jgi:putative CocE/NonD family hydrolase
MGPWFHGGWARSEGDRLGNVSFVKKTSKFYQERIELPFFNYYLKGKGAPPDKEVYAFETGANEWRTYDAWPPPSREMKRLYFREESGLSFASPGPAGGFDEYLSDPSHPVPYIDHISNSRGREYMTDDQRFAWQRPDVVSFETGRLADDVTIAGPILSHLFVSTSGTDADFIVKLIDVFPDDTPDDPHNPSDRPLGGYQMLVRAEVMRARYRNSYEHPEPLKPNAVERVDVPLQDVNHTFKKGHRIMVQVQSSWFPLVDRNPQKFVNIYQAKDSDFERSTIRIYHSAKYASHLEVGVLPGAH